MLFIEIYTVLSSGPHDVQQVLCLCCGNPHYQYNRRDERIEHSPDEKGLLVNYKLDMSQQCALAAKKVAASQESWFAR